MLKIVLSSSEMELGRVIGTIRNQECIDRNIDDKNYEDEGSEFKNHIQGAQGEIAVAKMAGIYWDGSVNTFKLGGDVGSIQVRTTRTGEAEFAIREGDRDKDIYVFVWAKFAYQNTFYIMGYLTGKEAKNAVKPSLKYGNERVDTHYIPSNIMRPITEPFIKKLKEVAWKDYDNEILNQIKNPLEPSFLTTPLKDVAISLSELMIN